MATNKTYDTTRPLHDFPGGAANSAGMIESATASCVSGWRSYTGNSATSGSSYGGRFQHYIVGAAGSGAALRSYALVKGVAAGSLYGLEATAEIMSTASSAASNEIYAIKGVLDINLSSTTTQVAALNLEIDVASGKTLAPGAGGGSAFIKCDITGTGTWTPALFYLPDAIGSQSATALVSTVKTAATNWSHGIRIDAAGTPLWIMATSTTPAA